MHYIVGTHFTIDLPKHQMGARRSTSNTLPAGNTYQLIYIAKKENGLEYHFVDVSRNRHTVHFNTARDADAFIARHRREVLPDYNAVTTEDVLN